MSYEISASIRVRLPDEPKAQAEQAAVVLTAWKAFVAAASGEGSSAELHIGPVYESVMVRTRKRRRGRPRKQPNGGDAMAAVDEFQRQAGVS